MENNYIGKERESEVYFKDSLGKNDRIWLSWVYGSNYIQFYEVLGHICPQHVTQCPQLRKKVFVNV